MKNFLGIVLIALWCFAADAATIQWYSQQTPTTTLSSGDIFALESPFQTGYKSITYANLAHSLSNTFFANKFDSVWTNNTVNILPLDPAPLLLSLDTSTSSKTTLYYRSLLTDAANPSSEALSYLQSQKIGPSTYATTLNLRSVASGGNVAEITMSAQANNTAVSSLLTLSTNSITTFSLNLDGVASGNGFKDSSIAVGSVVSVGPGGRFVGTNIALTMTNLYILQTQYVNFSITTNFNATYAYTEYQTNNYFWSTNAYIQNINGNKATINNIFVLDATFTNGIYIYTNTWANAPTGTVDLRFTDQYVKTYTPMSITGFTSKSNYVTESVVMTITNAASTNIGVFTPDGFMLDTRTNCLTVSNASIGVLSMRYHPVGLTNGIYKQW